MLVKNCILTMQGILLRTVKLIIARLLASYIPGRQKQFGFFTVYFKDTMVFREAYETGKRGTLSDFFLLVIRRKRSFCSYLCKIKKTETHTFGQFSAGGFLMKKSSRFWDHMMFKAAIPTQIITSKVNLSQSGSVFWNYILVWKAFLPGTLNNLDMEQTEVQKSWGCN